VYDKDGKVLYTNRSFEELSGTGKPAGRFTGRPSGNNGFELLATRSMDSGENVSSEIEMSGRHFLCGITAIPAKKEFVSVFHDITQLKQMEKLRRTL